MKRCVAIQADPLEDLNFETDTSLMLGYAAQKRGYQVFFYTPQNLSLFLTSETSRPYVKARGRWITFRGALFEKSYQVSEEETFDLSEASVLLIRQNPPVDMTYLTTTYLLDHLPHSVLIINTPKALRECPEKIFPLEFPHLFPPTLISRDILEIEEFLKKYKKIVVKPLYKYGGKDIFLLESGKGFKELLSALFEKEHEPYMFQKYLPEISLGDKRLFLLDGEALGLFIRVPLKGSFLANTFQGARVERTPYTPREEEIVETLKDSLRKKGLLFVGADIIGGYITEINSTSPTGLAFYNRLENVSLEEVFWNKIEELLHSRRPI